MRKATFVPVPETWSKLLSGSNDDIKTKTADFEEAVTEMFMCYFASAGYGKLERYPRMNATSLYRDIIKVIRETSLASTEDLDFGYIKVVDHLEFCCFDLESYIATVKQLDEIFFAFLAGDEGYDLSLDGYLNTDIVNAKRMLLDLFTGILNTSLENDKEDQSKQTQQ